MAKILACSSSGVSALVSVRTAVRSGPVVSPTEESDLRSSISALNTGWLFMAFTALQASAIVLK